MLGDDDAETWIGVAMEARKVVLKWEYLREEEWEGRIGKCPQSSLILVMGVVRLPKQAVMVAILLQLP